MYAYIWKSIAKANIGSEVTPVTCAQHNTLRAHEDLQITRTDCYSHGKHVTSCTCQQMPGVFPDTNKCLAQTLKQIYMVYVMFSHSIITLQSGYMYNVTPVIKFPDKLKCSYCLSVHW